MAQQTPNFANRANIDRAGHPYLPGMAEIAAPRANIISASSLDGSHSVFQYLAPETLKQLADRINKNRQDWENQAVAGKKPGVTQIQKFPAFRLPPLPAGMDGNTLYIPTWQWCNQTGYAPLYWDGMGGINAATFEACMAAVGLPAGPLPAIHQCAVLGGGAAAPAAPALPAPVVSAPLVAVGGGNGGGSGLGAGAGSGGAAASSTGVGNP